MKTLFGRKVAVDASMSIYQFLIAVRQKDGEMLTNDAGETTRCVNANASPQSAFGAQALHCASYAFLARLDASTLLFHCLSALFQPLS